MCTYSNMSWVNSSMFYSAYLSVYSDYLVSLHVFDLPSRRFSYIIVFHILVLINKKNSIRSFLSPAFNSPNTKAFYFKIFLLHNFQFNFASAQRFSDNNDYIDKNLEQYKNSKK
jgi:hypothetical protein